MVQNIKKMEIFFWKKIVNEYYFFLKKRLSMNSFFFVSINVGPLHLTLLSTEFYFFLRYGVDQIFNQFYWLSEDLEVCFYFHNWIRLNTVSFRDRPKNDVTVRY